jgi:TRAP-type mannitol/chloroaromatic compound transport system permease large subunit
VFIDGEDAPLADDAGDAGESASSSPRAATILQILMVWPRPVLLLLVAGAIVSGVATSTGGAHGASAVVAPDVTSPLTPLDTLSWLR